MTVLAFSPADHNWRTRGLCAIDDELWYPSPKSTKEQVEKQIEAAKGVCQVCPVLARCRADIEAAEGNTGLNYRFGIVAGMTPRERHKAYLRSKEQTEAKAAA